MKKNINILCLHGCNQSREIFETITKHFREISFTFSKTNDCNINFHYTEALYDHSCGGKSWYNVEFDISKIGTIEYDSDTVNPTINHIDKLVSELNIDVLLGFSQGGNVVDTYLVNKTNSIKCAIIFSGYNFIDENRNVNVETHVMNVISEEDKIVPSKFMPIYKNMEVRYHNKGHKLPTSKPFVRNIIEYIYNKN